MAQMTKANYLKVVAYALGFLLLVLGLAGICATNELKIVGDYTVVYPSVYKSIFLNLGLVNVVGALLFAGFAAYVCEAFGTDTGDWLGEMTTGKIILFIAVPAVFAIATLIGHAYDVQTFTHVTLPTTEFQALKSSNLDKLFHTSYQADSLYNVAHRVK